MREARTIAITRIAPIPVSRIAIGACLSIGIIVLGLLYLFFIARTIVTVANRRELEETIKDARSRVAELELAYYSQSQQITLVRAQELGYHDLASPSFAQRTSSVAQADVAHEI